MIASLLRERVANDRLGSVDRVSRRAFDRVRDLALGCLLRTLSLRTGLIPAWKVLRRGKAKPTELLVHSAADLLGLIRGRRVRVAGIVEVLGVCGAFIHGFLLRILLLRLRLLLCLLSLLVRFAGGRGVAISVGHSARQRRSWNEEVGLT